MTCVNSIKSGKPTAKVVGTPRFPVARDVVVWCDGPVAKGLWPGDWPRPCPGWKTSQRWRLRRYLGFPWPWGYRHHPFLDGFFHYKPSSYGGTYHHVVNTGCCLRVFLCFFKIPYPLEHPEFVWASLVQIDGPGWVRSQNLFVLHH